MNKRAIIYARVSTDEQAERGYSLSTQLEAMREYCQRNGFTVIAEIADDCSGSIPVLERPGGGQVYQYLNNKRADVIVLYTIDRTARDKRDYPIEFLLFLRDVQDAGAELHYVDTGKSEGSIIDLFKAWQAGEERKKIVERSVRGRQAKARAGKWVGDSNPPYGYKKVGRLQDSRLEISEPEAAVVRRIFSLYIGLLAERLPLLGISALLTEEGIPPPRVGKRGEVWYTSTVKRILRNPAYLGQFSYAHNTIRIDLPHLAIVTPELWAAAQEQTRKNRELAGRNNKKYDYLLRGRLKCSCGLTLIGTPAHSAGGDVYLYYACGRYRGDRHILDCTESYLRVVKTDSLVWGWIYELVSDDEKLTEGFREWQRQNSQQLEPKQARLSALGEMKTRAERSIARLAEAYRFADSEEEATVLERERKIAVKQLIEIKAERAQLKKDLAKVELTPARLNTIRLAVGEIRGRLGDANFEQKREVLDLFCFAGKIGYQDDVRGLWCTCTINPDPEFLRFDSHFSAPPCD